MREPVWARALAFVVAASSCKKKKGKSKRENPRANDLAWRKVSCAHLIGNHLRESVWARALA
jgi:hypothetical protein